jgi:hypothetical protein
MRKEEGDRSAQSIVQGDSIPDKFKCVKAKKALPCKQEKSQICIATKY